MSKVDRRSVVGSDTQTIVVDHAPVVTSWRDSLTVDDLATVADALDYAKFWEGVPNYSWKILVAKLANLLDGH